MSEVGFDLYPWQLAVLEPWLAHADNGMWAASSAGLSVPRQNGKTEGVIIPRIVFGMTVYGEWVVYTAQVQPTATETFEAIATIYDHPAIRNRVKSIKTGQGREEIRLKNGGRIKFLARTRKGGRGQHGDLLVFDEAQELSDGQQDSFMPAISSSLNPQTIYAGTPPKPEDGGFTFRRIRKDALSGKTEHVAWAEWGVDMIPPEPKDASLWAETNPSLDVRVLRSTIEAEQEAMTADGFARERLGWWSPDENILPSAIDAADWAKCTVVKAPPPAEDERLVAGVKFSPDGAVYSLSIAARQGDDPVLVECLEREATSHGIGHLIDWINDRRGTLALVCIDGREWTATLAQRLADLGYPKRGVQVMRTTEVVDACAMLSGAVLGGNVIHIAQPLLNQSVASSTRRSVGREGWAFAGPDPTPIESAALAYYGAMTTKRNPKRKMRVGV